MVPIIMAALQMAKSKADAQNAQNQQLADQMRNNQLVAGQQVQLPSIKSVFGQY